MIYRSLAVPNPVSRIFTYDIGSMIKSRYVIRHYVFNITKII